jgi:hypothetical protein
MNRMSTHVGAWFLWLMLRVWHDLNRLCFCLGLTCSLEHFRGFLYDYHIDTHDTSEAAVDVL